MKYLILALATALSFSSLAHACASCGCTLSSNWQETDQKGFKLDLRYDFIDQDQLRNSTSTISGASASQRTNDGDPQEVEGETKNSYLTATADYSFNQDYKISLQVPYIFRYHSTLGTASDGYTPGAGGGQYTSKTSNLGDIKLLGRYQGFSPQHNLGVLFGVKLPTGSHTLNGNSTDPTATDTSVPIDRGLQPGTGTTDLIVGLYYSEAIAKNWDDFEELIYQIALNSADQYRPGDGLNVNFGLRYFGVSAFVPQIQINSRMVQHDTGNNADEFSTGGTIVYLSPGLIVPIAESAAEVYAFVQLPIYQNLRGVQLAPTYTASLGGRYRF